MNDKYLYAIAVIVICTVCTFAERLLPFVVFGKGEVAPVIRKLGQVLPLAIMTTLVVYCLKDTSFSSPESFVPQLVAVAVTAALHLWKKNTLLSVVGGTLTYMGFVQFVFK